MSSPKESGVYSSSTSSPGIHQQATIIDGVIVSSGLVNDKGQALGAIETALAHFEDMVRRNAAGDRSNDAVSKARRRLMEHVAAPAVPTTPDLTSEQPDMAVAWRYWPSDVYPDVVLTDDPMRAELARRHGRPVEALHARPLMSSAEGRRCDSWVASFALTNHRPPVAREVWAAVHRLHTQEPPR